VLKITCSFNWEKYAYFAFFVFNICFYHLLLFFCNVGCIDETQNRVLLTSDASDSCLCKGDRVDYRLYAISKELFLAFMQEHAAPAAEVAGAGAVVEEEENAAAAATTTGGEGSVEAGTSGSADAAAEANEATEQELYAPVVFECERMVPAVEQAAEEEEETTWQCEVCTLINALEADECSVCSAPRPLRAVLPGGGMDINDIGSRSPRRQPRGSAGGSGGAGGGSSGGGAGWWCTSCTFINPISATRYVRDFLKCLFLY
jgi:uncharacterized membrane protein YgcG